MKRWDYYKYERAVCLPTFQWRYAAIENIRILLALTWLLQSAERRFRYFLYFVILKVYHISGEASLWFPSFPNTNKFVCIFDKTISPELEQTPTLGDGVPESPVNLLIICYFQTDRLSTQHYLRIFSNLTAYRPLAMIFASASQYHIYLHTHTMFKHLLIIVS